MQPKILVVAEDTAAALAGVTVLDKVLTTGSGRQAQLAEALVLNPDAHPSERVPYFRPSLLAKSLNPGLRYGGTAPPIFPRGKPATADRGEARGRTAEGAPGLRRLGWTRGGEAVAGGDRRHRRTGQLAASLAVSEEDVDGACAQAARRRTIGWLLWPSKYSTSSTVLARPPSRIGAAGLAHAESAGHRARGSQRGAWFPGGRPSCTS